MKQKLLALGLIAASVFIAFMMNILKPVPDKSETPEPAIAVKTKILQRKDVRLIVESQGTVKASTRTILTSEVSGPIVKVSNNFVVGGVFKKGDVLMQIDPNDYEVALQRAEAQLVSRKASLEFEKARAYQAKKEWAMTGKPESEAPKLALRKPFLSEAEAMLLQAKAEVNQAHVKLRRTAIRAPYAGMVSEKIADIGQYVTPGMGLGEIFSTNQVEVRLPLTDKDLSMIYDVSSFGAMQSGEVILEGSVNGYLSRWVANIVRSEGVVNERNRSQYIVVGVKDPYRLKQDKSEIPAPLLVGTFVRAAIPGRILKNVFKVPRSGLLDGSRVATVDDESRLRLYPVNVVFADEDSYYVTEGLAEGAQVIISAIGTPVEGLKLKVKDE